MLGRAMCRDTPQSLPAASRLFSWTFLVCFCLWLSGSEVALTAPAAGGADRLTVAVLNPNNETGDPQQDHWACTIASEVQARLRNMPSLHLRSQAAVEYGLRQVRAKRGDPIDARRAREIGELIEARRVVWGKYERHGTNLQLSLALLNVASGKEQSRVQVTVTNWQPVLAGCALELVHALGQTPTAEQIKDITRQITHSEEAFAWLSKGYAAYINHEPLTILETAFRQALALDPDSAWPHGFLAAALGSQGKFDEASAELDIAMRLDPDDSSSYRMRAIICMHRSQVEDALKAIERSIELDPEDPDTLDVLGQMRAMENSWDEALDAWEKAVANDPFSAEYHASLARGYAHRADRARALAEIREAERLDPNDLNSRQMICLATHALHEDVTSLEQHEKFIALARKQGVAPEMVRIFEERAESLRARLTPHFQAVDPPQRLTAAALAQAIRERLSPAEVELVTAPLAGSAAIEAWARELTRNATNDPQKAQALYQALAGRIDPGGGGSRTALETFAAWKDSSISLRCQEHARLFVALARAVDLQAFYVAVDQDCDGDYVPHDCACVFIDGKALLVDSTYRWFGVPHKGFTILDDLRAISRHMCQLNPDLERVRIATKLDPDSAVARFNLALGLGERDQLSESRQVLREGLKLGTNTWYAEYTQGVFALWEKRRSEAEKFLRRALEMNPLHQKTHFLLAVCLQELERLPEARQAFRATLRCQDDFDETTVQAARRALAELNEELGRLGIAAELASSPTNAIKTLPRWEPKPARLLVQETPVAKVPLLVDRTQLTVSADGRHIAYPVRRSGEWIIGLDGNEGPRFKRVGAAEFSPDSQHFVYVGTTSTGVCAVLDGKPGPVWDEIAPAGRKLLLAGSENETGPPGVQFSPDSQHLVYVGRRGRQWHLVRNQVPGPAWDKIYAPRFSTNGQRLAFVGVRSNEWFLVNNDVPGKPYRQIHSPPIFSPDGQRLACLARDGENIRVVIDGVEGPPCKAIGLESLGFSPDGQQVTYASRLGSNDVRFMVNHQEQFQCEEIWQLGPVFSPQGGHLVYAARKGDEYFMVHNGQAERRFTMIPQLPPVFSLDDRRLAYPAARHRRFFVVVDGKEYKAYDGYIEGSLVFSPDGQRFAYACEREKQCLVVVDGVPGATFDRVAPGSVSFSPDSRHVAYLAKRGEGALVVINTQEFPAWTDVSPMQMRFTQDSGHHVHVALQNGRRALFLDGQQQRVYEALFGQLNLDTLPVTNLIAIRADEMFNLEFVRLELKVVD